MASSSSLVIDCTSEEKEGMWDSSHDIPSTCQIDWEEIRKEWSYIVTQKVTPTIIECMFV